MVVGEIANPGKPSTIVFFQLEADRLRAGIFSISVKDDATAALKAFGSFRGNARQLARALERPEMELVGAAVMNPQIAEMLGNRLGFEKSFEPLPESLGALPGETIEVFTKRFPVQSATGEATPDLKGGPKGGGGGGAPPAAGAPPAGVAAARPVRRRRRRLPARRGSSLAKRRCAPPSAWPTTRRSWRASSARAGWRKRISTDCCSTWRTRR